MGVPLVSLGKSVSGLLCLATAGRARTQETGAKQRDRRRFGNPGGVRREERAARGDRLTAATRLGQAPRLGTGEHRTGVGKFGANNEAPVHIPLDRGVLAATGTGRNDARKSRRQAAKCADIAAERNWRGGRVPIEVTGSRKIQIIARAGHGSGYLQKEGHRYRAEAASGNTGIEGRIATIEGVVDNRRHHMKDRMRKLQVTRRVGQEGHGE